MLTQRLRLRDSKLLENPAFERRVGRPRKAEAQRSDTLWRVRLSKLLKVPLSQLQERLEDIAGALRKSWVPRRQLEKRFRVSRYALEKVREYLQRGEAASAGSY